MPGRRVFLFEDHPERQRLMCQVLADLLPEHDIHIADDAANAIAWLNAWQHEVDLISLDHDMDSCPRGELPPIDHGCGRDVANFLAARPPTAPVIIHTSNYVAGIGMFQVLHWADWPVWRVYPFDEHAWIADAWRTTLQRLIERKWLTPRS
jgi:CheY-like chemotaxis protein